MDADTKRGAVWLHIGKEAPNGGVYVTLAALCETLAAQGLHVVTAADKAVLDACAAAHILTFDDGTFNYRLDDIDTICTAELARREAAK